MEPAEYRRMFEQEDRHWWFQSRLQMTEGLLRKYILPAAAKQGVPRLLDLGCGTGLFLQRRAQDARATGLDFSAQALEFCRERGLTRIARGDATRLPFANDSFDVVTAFDLIEHVAGDERLIEEIWRVLRPGGWVLASVPAHPLLWSAHDISLHHQRRYTRTRFERLFEAAKWTRVRQTGSFAMILAPAAIKRLSERIVKPEKIAADTRRTAPWLNAALIRLHKLEAAWLTHCDLPTGLSLLTLRRKRGQE